MWVNVVVTIFAYDSFCLLFFVFNRWIFLYHYLEISCNCWYEIKLIKKSLVEERSRNFLEKKSIINAESRKIRFHLCSNNISSVLRS